MSQTPTSPRLSHSLPPVPTSRFKRPRCCHRVRPIAALCPSPLRHGDSHPPTGDPGTLGKSPLAKASSSDVLPQPPSPTMTALTSVSGVPELCPPRSCCMEVSGEATEPVWPRAETGMEKGDGKHPPGPGCGCHLPAGPARRRAGAAVVTAAATHVQVSWHTGDLLPAGPHRAQASHCHLHVLPARVTFPRTPARCLGALSSPSHA